MAFLELVAKMVFYIIRICIFIFLACFIFLKLISPHLILQPRAEALAYNLVDYATTNDRLLTKKYIWTYLQDELRGDEFVSLTYRQRAGDRRFFIDLTLRGTALTLGERKVTYKGLLYDSVPRQSTFFTVYSYDKLDEITETVGNTIEEREKTKSLDDKDTVQDSFTKAEEEQSQPLNGALIYNQSCASCHGQYLEGGAGPSLININQKYTDDELSQIIEKGIEPGMPANIVQSSEKDIIVEWFISAQ
jgi:mono/diheme cytochrome c family protein